MKETLSSPNTDYLLVRDADVVVKGKSLLNYSYNILKADVIIMEDNIVLILSKSFFRGRMKMSQPIGQYFLKNNTAILAGVSNLNRFENLEYQDNHITFKVSVFKSIKGRLEVKIKITDKDLDLSPFYDKYHRPFAISAMIILCFSLMFFFIQFAETFSKHLFWKRMIQINGILSMTSTIFIFTKYHDLMTIISSIFGLLVVIGIIVLSMYCVF